MVVDGKQAAVSYDNYLATHFLLYFGNVFRKGPFWGKAICYTFSRHAYADCLKQSLQNSEKHIVTSKTFSNRNYTSTASKLHHYVEVWQRIEQLQ